MTDATTPEQPRTAAGRALLEWRSIPRIPIRYILAIEAEAQARPAVASEGLRAALGRLLTAIDMFAPEFAADVAVVAARAALASDAGSVGALDVERLRIIATISENRVTVEQADALGWLDGWLTDAEREGEQT